MEMYAEPKRGGYTHRTRNYDGTFNTHYLTVEVLGETDKSYLVKVFVPIGGKPAGSRMTVRKHNVKIQGEQPVAAPRPARRYVDCTNAYWHN